MTLLGTVRLEDWDAGVFRTLGCELMQAAVDGAVRTDYVLRVPGVDAGVRVDDPRWAAWGAALDGRIPCRFKNPEDVFAPYVLPLIVVARSDLTPAYERQPWYHVAARGPARGARAVVRADGTRGWDRYEEQLSGDPFDIAYEVRLFARRQASMYRIFHYVLGRLRPPSFTFGVVDSLGEAREYDAVEVSISDTSELADIADRTAGWTFGFTVRAEIDLSPSTEAVAVQETRVAVQPR